MFRILSIGVCAIASRCGLEPLIQVAEYSIALLIFAVAIWLPGYAIERFFFRQSDLGALRGLCRAVLGPALWIAVAFILAAVGALSQLAVLSLACIFTLCAFLGWRSEGGGRSSEGGSLDSPPPMTSTRRAIR